MAQYQGGKQYGKMKQAQESALDEINDRYKVDPDYNNDNYPDLEDQLISFKKQFMEFDEDHSGDIDIMELKRMMEKLGQAKTHLELKKMISEVDRDNTGTISYEDFLIMMLGKKSSILKIILMFEEKAKAKEVPRGLPPKRDLSSLP